MVKDDSYELLRNIELNTTASTSARLPQHRCLDIVTMTSLLRSSDTIWTLSLLTIR